MRAVALQHANVAQGEQQQSTRGRSLTSNYAPLNLENKFLAQTSTLTPQPCSLLLNVAAQPFSCPSLQPSSLSSTSSSLLSTSSCSASIISPLLSTENKLLSSCSLLSSSSLTPAVNKSLVCTSVSSSALLSCFAHPPSSLHKGLDGELKKDDREDKDGEEMCGEMQSCYEETSTMYSEEDDLLPVEAEEEEGAAGTTLDLPVLEAELGSQEQEDSLIIRQEFVEDDRADDKHKEELKDKKYLLLNAVCCSLVNKSKAPGQEDWDSDKSVWTNITNLAKDISVSDPEFLLKVAIYTRQQLNIRITANFLLALAAKLPSTKPHLRRYFCAAMQLPTDWLEVVRIYSTCFSRSLPMCLKKALTDKFKEFSEYQLAKYNTRKHRCKHNRNRPKSKKPTEQQLTKWADLLRSDASILETFLKGSKTVVDKKQSEFSLKKMIKRLHIKEPAEHVMAILGKKYPADLKTFTRSGMKGVWQRERAGQRMKLNAPETWERLLSLEGNNATTWEKLIDSNSLPFMAMLRNLRNIITEGISEAHHQKILSRLTNKKAVIQSRQFPFRFLAAYKVIMELHILASASQQALPPAKDILKGILKKIPKSKRFKRHDWDTTARGRIRVALGVPFIYNLYKKKRANLLKSRQRQYSVALLDRYRKALETAVQISCRYNVPPLPGRTVIFIDRNQNEDCALKQDFCLPPDPEQKKDNEEDDSRNRRKKQEDDKLNPTILEVAVLLSLMIASSAEDCQLYMLNWSDCEEITLKSDVLLDNVKSVVNQIKETESIENNECILTELMKKNKVDNIIVLSASWINCDIEQAISHFRKDVNDNALVVKIFMSHKAEPQYTSDRNCVSLTGFSDQILRFVGERGSSRLLDHMEHLDKLYKIRPPEGTEDPQATNKVVQIPAVPRWQAVRVFISSTFRDMHAERDILVQSVFPELRRRAASHCLYLQEVELRWGVTEEESARATELCLSEVCRSQMMVAILGERYGLVPPKPVLPDLPLYKWLASAPEGLSITEMEIRQFEALYSDMAPQRMFCYFRDPNVIKTIPVAWRSDFVAESKEAEFKMASLKKRLRSNAKVTENYPCEWGGIMDGKPYFKKLEDFGKAVLHDLWMALLEQFVEDDKCEAMSDVTEQEMHQGALQRQFFGRGKLLVGAVEKVEQIQNKGGMMVVEGGPGEGKTVFMAALAAALRNGGKSKKFTCDVISYSTTASQSARSVENLLQCLVRCLRKMSGTEEDSSIPQAYKNLLSEFHSSLSDRKKTPMVLLVDGVDLVEDGRGQLNSDWIPQQLPQGVCLVVSITSSAALLQTLAKKRSTVLFSLGQLTMLDRKEIVQKGLDTFGKKLSDSAFNNQLQTLIMKKGAVSPLYLHLACEDLRNFASFDKLKECLHSLPQSLGQLVEYSLDRLCSQYRDLMGLRQALAVLTVSTTGLRERDLYSVLNTCNELSSRDGPVTWQEVLHEFRRPKGRIPMTSFMGLVQSLKSLIGLSYCHNTDDLLILTNPGVRRAFEDFLLPSESDRKRAYLILAAHLWALADQQGTDTFLHCEANTIMHLPSSLIQSGQLEVLHSLLSSYYFLYANVHHGFLHKLLDTYSSFDDKHTSEPSCSSNARLKDCCSFLQRHALLLSSWPNLCIQQAINEPPGTSAHVWAQGLVKKGGVRIVEWLNSDKQLVLEPSELVSTFTSEPTCLAVSSDGQLMVAGTKQGMLHVINTHNRQEVKSLTSSCDGISSCVFLKDGCLGTTSFDGRIEMWDIENGCRTALFDAHTNAITASDISADGKHLVTVSLDSTLKVWSSNKGHKVAACLSPGPLNCVSFDPGNHLLAAGCWNGNVIMWNWLQNKTDMSLCGHKSSVRSLSFSSSSMLCSGSMSGEIRVWSVPTSTCVGCFQAHSGATEALIFLEEGSMLLSAGSDNMLQLWSGGLGRSAPALKNYENEGEPPLKKQRFVTSEPAALCVAVNGDCAAVGYHGDGLKLFSLDTGETVRTPKSLDVSILCLLWVDVDPEKAEPELLLAGGGDNRVRVLRVNKGEQGMWGSLNIFGMFGTQQGAILALAQNTTCLATASDDCTIALWLLSDLGNNTLEEPHALLRGHNGGVTCLAFSPDGGQLLSGGKDQALMVWDVSVTPAVLSKSLPHSHRDWITSCVWTPGCVISSSNDGRLCLWDLHAGQRLKEISWKSPLTSVCSLGQYVIASCAEGALHVWTWDTSMEICHISAHKQRINHCTLLPNTGNKEVSPEEMTVFSASDDGTVQLWKPLQVQHFSTFLGHNGAICGVVHKEGLQEFFSVSEDCTLRCWTWTTEAPPNQKGAVTALCFSPRGDILLAGYKSGLLEIWQHNILVGHKQISDSAIRAICSMPDNQFAVSNMNPAVDVWTLVWNQQRNNASLLKVNTFKVKVPVVHLNYCTLLIGVTNSGKIFHVSSEEEEHWTHTVTDWDRRTRILGLIPCDEKSIWLVGESGGNVELGFLFAMGPKYSFSSAFSSLKLNTSDGEKEESMISALTVNKDFMVCGDVRGNMWFIMPLEASSWSHRKNVHSDRISALRLTERTIISASYDRTVKIWDRNTKKQVGMFVCDGPVVHLELNPENPTKLVCGDIRGKLYFLSWNE